LREVGGLDALLERVVERLEPGVSRPSIVARTEVIVLAQWTIVPTISVLVARGL